MVYKLLFVSIILALAGFVSAQTTEPVKPTEDTAKLEKEAVEFLRETSTDVGRLRTAENRISFNSELASLMWFHDEKEAKVMYGAVISDFNQLLSQFDSQMNMAVTPGDDDQGSSGGLFGNFGKTKVERKFRIAMAVRQQIAMSLAEHAPDLAYNFFYDSQGLISNPQFRKETEQSDKYFELQLIRQMAETDAAKAAEYGKQSIKNGLDNSHIELLKKIYAKDVDKGIEFGEAILSRLKSDKSAARSPYFYDTLLSFADSNLNASKKPGAKKPVYDRDDVREIADLFAQFILSNSKDEDIYGASAYADRIDKYSPGRGAQIRARFKDVRTGAGLSTYSGNAMSNTSNYRSGLSTGTGMGNANSAPDPERAAREEREKNEKQMMEDVSSLGTKPLPKDERDKVVARARKIISQTPGKDKKIVALSMLAAQVAHAGDKDLADEIMHDAERLVNTEPQNYQDFLYCWMLAGGYTEVNPDKAFPLLENTILRANETISAFVKVAEFIDVDQELIDDGEVQVGMFGGSMIRELTGQLGMASSTIKLLAKADFAKTKNLTNVFDRTEIRVLAKMMVLRAVLDKRDAKSDDVVKDDTDSGDENTAPPPPKPGSR